MKRMTEGKLRKSLAKAVYTLAETIEYRDPFTAVHQAQVAGLVCLLAKGLGLSAEETTGLRTAAILHDIGNLNIPGEILTNPGSLSEIEMRLVRNHPREGYDLLKGIEFPWPVAKIVLQHHERLNGSGYPGGLAGGRILLEARILCVADVMEAMVSRRPYREGLGLDKAREELIGNKGILYEPKVVDVCLDIFGRKKFRFPMAY